ncbi:MAG: OB-fold domain-containing protein [Deltaproteobacteria bacterium]|nr:OB-fold domain-containing protein [Deltaproteobacteria bacterium]
MAEATATYKKPLPKRRGVAGQFYDFCKKHELRFQRCTSCQTWRHVPRDMCAKCGSFDWEWAKSSGKGKVFSWTTAEQVMLPQFADDVPYNASVIELEEGVRMVSWVIDIPNDELRLDLPVEVFFDDVTPEVTLPKFRRMK